MNFCVRAIRKLRQDGPLETIEQGRYEIWKRIAMPVTDYLYSQYVLLERDKLREAAVVTRPTKTKYLPVKGAEGVGDTPKRKYYRPGDRFVATVENARLIGRKGLAIAQDDQIIVDCVAPPIIVPRRPKIAIRAALRDLGPRALSTEPTETLDHVAPLLPPFTNYYHWTVECLMKIYMLEVYGEENGSYPALLVPHNRPGWINETLQLIDYPGKIVQWSGQTSKVKQLVVPTFPDPVVEECDWLRSRMREQVDTTDDANKRLFVSREDATTRQISNRSEVETILSDFGFETIVPGERSVTEQVELFSQADVIVGPHGAGLTNVLYATNGTVLELSGVKRSATFARLSEMCDHDYRRIHCENRHGNLVVDTDQLAKLIPEK